jgi:hypothetical protein
MVLFFVYSNISNEMQTPNGNILSSFSQFYSVVKDQWYADQ